MIAFTLAAVLFTVNSGWRPVRVAVALSCVVWMAFAAMTFARDAVYGQVAHSREDSTVKWKVFHAVLKLAGSRPIERGDLSRELLPPRRPL